jgi:long-chain acyl-CoA synthetase
MLFESLFEHARMQPEHLAVVDDTGQFTYRQLAETAGKFASYIASKTLRPRVGLLLPQGSGFVYSFFGTLLAGKTAVPINYLLGEREIAHIIADSEIDAVITVPPLIGRLADLPLLIIDLTQFSQISISPLGTLSTGDTKTIFPPASPGDVAVLLYTSGTSGLPKGVLLSYGNLEAVVDAAIRHAGLKHEHKFLGLIPLFHSFGITTMLGAICLGATTIYLGRFSPMATLNAIREHKPSLIFGIPSMFAALLRMKGAGAADFAHVYATISGGEPLPDTLRQAFQERFGIPLYEGYGLSETCAVVALNTPQAHRPGTVGRPLPGVEVQITDEGGAALPPGQSGEIWLRGPMIMKGYHNLPGETAATLTPEGFFKTGDLGVIDDDGFLGIAGRKKDLIIVSGEKVYPREIEEVLLKYPQVADAAVLGKQDAGRGEIVVAFVMPREGQNVTGDELRAFCRTEGLAQWKVPREVFVVSDLPRSPTGKILRRELAGRLSASTP